MARANSFVGARHDLFRGRLAWLVLPCDLTGVDRKFPGYKKLGNHRASSGKRNSTNSTNTSKQMNGIAAR